MTELYDIPVMTIDGEAITLIPMDVPNLALGVKAGSRILLDDGNLEMEVTGVDGEAVHARVVLGGVLSSNKGVNLPGAELGITSFTDKDHADLEFGLHQGVDLVAISFVRTAADIETVRQAMRDLDPGHQPIPIIATRSRIPLDDISTHHTFRCGLVRAAS